MIEWIVGILTIPIVFWVLFLVELIWLIWAVEEESVAGSIWAILFAGTLGVLEFGSFGALFAFIKNNPVVLGIGFGAYMIAGTLWALFKWYLFVGKEATELRERILRDGRDKAAQALSGWEDGERNTQKILESNFACLAPQVRKYKSKVTFWIMFWVPSALWFFLNDPLRRAANWIFDQVKGIFQGVSDKAFKIE